MTHASSTSLERRADLLFGGGMYNIHVSIFTYDCERRGLPLERERESRLTVARARVSGCQLAVVGFFISFFSITKLIFFYVAMSNYNGSIVWRWEFSWLCKEQYSNHLQCVPVPDGSNGG